MIKVATPRRAELSRKTGETEVNVAVNLDGEGLVDAHTGVGFLDHMLQLLGHRSGMDLQITASGDLDVDDHHVTEDIAIVLGRAIGQAVGAKMSLRRYGSVLMPMDEVLVAVALDLSGRICFVSNYAPSREAVGDLSTEMISHFFKTLAAEARLTLHFNFIHRGENEHHRVEALFKGFGQALGQAVEVLTDRPPFVPSTKGVLEGVE